MKRLKKNSLSRFKRPVYEGIISITSRGTGYVRVPEMKEDPEVDSRHLNTALHGDLVEIVLHPKHSGKRQSAEVTKIISRARETFAGVLENEKGVLFLKPDDPKMYTDIIIPEKFLRVKGEAGLPAEALAKAGQKVFVQIVSWKDPMKAPEGKVLQILGRPGDNDVEMESIAIERGFVAKLPREVEREGELIRSRGITKDDYRGRRDFRNALTFTIDPADAKDFDDAISFKELPEGLLEVGIHIADVSHYVKPGGVLDREAQKRGTSVYLVDRTIPMLPEALSNDLCSLVPNKERLCMSAVFVIDHNGRVKNEWFGRTVIHSKKRFTYEEAERAIKDKSAPLHRELGALNSIAKKLTKKRFDEGAISLEAEEVKFLLDHKGAPVKVIKKERGDSNRLIEEFMLLANQKVAEKISEETRKHGEVFVYRVHDLPSKDKMQDLVFFLESIGFHVTLRNGTIPSKDINALLEKLAGRHEKDAVHRAIIRSMAKAVYSTKNIGHYGLAFKHYTHFTSPIRRYPDVMVHRIFHDFLEGKKIGKEKIQVYERMSIKASDQEKKAAEAERASIKYKQVEYMGKRIGQRFDGIISGITEWGLYVEEVETKCEGMVRVRDLADDFYVFNERRLALIGQNKKKIYKLGDRVKIKVKAADLERKSIDYILV